MSELMQLINAEKPVIIAICEIKPKNRKRELLLQDYVIPGYTLHSVNLENNLGRGVAVYTHDAINKSVLQIKPDLGYTEACLLEVRLRGGDVLLFCCFYRSPTQSSTSEKNNENLNNLLRCISQKNYSHKCFVGDFNYHDINWKTWTTHQGPGSNEVKFIETIRDCFLQQHMEELTRMRGNDEPSTIDLLFTDEIMQVSDVTYHSPLGKSHNAVITLKFHCYIDYAKTKEKYVYDKADFEGMRRNIKDSNWVEKFVSSGNGKSVEELWNSLKSKLQHLRDNFVPKTKISGKPSWEEKGNIPISKFLQEAIRNKHAKHRQWITIKKRGDANIARLNYNKARNKVSRMMRQAKRKLEKDIALKSKQNPKAFWSYIRRCMKTKTGVAPLLEDKTDKTTVKFSDEEKAQILQKQFSSIFTREPTDEIPTLGKLTEFNLSDTAISEDMVKMEMLKINVNKSPGPDDIHPRMLVELANDMSKPLAFLFNMSIKNGETPLDWKKARVSPIFKKGARNLAENYRPISLTSIVCKLMEKFVKEAVMCHLVSNNLLSTKQHGFISGRSTVTPGSTITRHEIK